MKILTASQIYEADRATIKNQAISSTELMERAACTCYEWIIRQFPDRSRLFHVCCGMGNNGGDGLVVSRLLIENGFRVHTYLINFSEHRSDDFKVNLDRLTEMEALVSEINKAEDFPTVESQDIVIDAIFGIGLKRSPSGFTKKVIQKINGSQADIISLDFPSGLFSASPVTDKEAVIRAKYTLTFQVPKLAFLLPENEEYIEQWEVLDIGLDKAYLESATCLYHLSDQELNKSFYKVRKRFSHKGTFGHSLLIGGSFGKIGAMILASRAALKAGSGLVSTYIPKCGYTAMQSANPEVMVEVDDEKYIQFFNFKTNPTAIGVGPGLGTHIKTKKGFVDFFSNCKIPLVIDADGLNIIAEFSDLSELIPENTILTPHPKEFERLVGKWQNDYEKLDKLLAYSQQYKCVIVLKGSYTAIAYQGKIWFNMSGNPALATAGSGDVLTGIITALLSQGYPSLEASLMGVYIHGRTADLAIEENESMESFSALNAIGYLGRVYKEFL
jgi:hydroxyethylthiazole kinase-like uncharacterized protein yjeF